MPVGCMGIQLDEKAQRTVYCFGVRKKVRVQETNYLISNSLRYLDNCSKKG